MQPKGAKQYRQRKAPSGTKTNYLDAWSLADALRTDGHGWRPLSEQDPLVEELRWLCRDEVELIGQRTALVNQLQAALYEYYPVALEAFDDWTQPFSWMFVKAFATPEALVKAGRRRQLSFLHQHRLWREQTAEKRLEIFARAEGFCANPAVSRAKSRLALSLVEMLLTLERQVGGVSGADRKAFCRASGSRCVWESARSGRAVGAAAVERGGIGSPAVW